jgi:hypothetical protein
MAHGVGPPHLADATDLERWADQRSAQADLPRLVRRLIRHENDQHATQAPRRFRGSSLSQKPRRSFTVKANIAEELRSVSLGEVGAPVYQHRGATTGGTRAFERLLGRGVHPLARHPRTIPTR